MAEREQAALELDINYVGRVDIERLLGSSGQQVLNKVLEILGQSAMRLHWPLVRVEARYTRDAELASWEYVLLILAFSCSFEMADKHLRDFYSQLDALTQRMTGQEKLVLQRLIFFDIEPIVTVSAA